MILHNVNNLFIQMLNQSDYNFAVIKTILKKRMHRRMMNISGRRKEIASDNYRDYHGAEWITSYGRVE